jgi:adenylate kinase
MINDKLIIILFGAAGSGKGTQNAMICSAMPTLSISPGERLRKIMDEQPNDPIAIKIKDNINNGQLADVSLVNEVMYRSIHENHNINAYQNIILDGYPRIIQQDEYLRNEICKNGSVDIAIYLKIDKQTLIHRLENRFNCKKCGAIYNKIKLQPKVDGVCDHCGGEDFNTRIDDSDISSINKRFEIFEKDTMPVIMQYEQDGKVISINAEQDPVVIHNQIMQILYDIKK